jgi:uncharacterized membrane protein
VTAGFGELAVALALFFASHSLPAIRPVRAGLVAAIGERGFLLIYSAVATLATVWVIVAALNAPGIELWPMTVAGMWVTVVTMAFAALFLAWGLTAANPLSIKIRPRAFDPNKPGVIAVTRHPILWSFVLWGLGHLASNGDVGTVILFGMLGGFGLIGTLILDARRKRELGLAAWQAAAGRTSSVPFAAILRGRTAMPWRALASWPTAAGIVVYVAAMLAHHSVIGVSPLPP